MSERRIVVGLGARSYPVLVGPGLIGRAGALIAPYAPRRRTADQTGPTSTG